MIAWDETGSGPSLVLVHGITEDRRAWHHVLPALAAHFRCVRLDLRNHGASPDAEDGSALAMAADVAEVVAAAGIVEPPLLVGHSLGAIVVTAYAAQAPARAVVDIDQSLRFDAFAALVQPLAPMLRGPEFGNTVLAIFGALGADDLPHEVTGYLDAQHQAARPEAVLGVWDMVLDGDLAELAATADALLGAVRVPYLAIHGADPGAGYADWLAERVPGAQVEVWGIGGHYPHLADPDRFAARIAALDASVRGSGSG
jgi:pimeloyl-ACP methyl ester carboxylesterase